MIKVIHCVWLFIAYSVKAWWRVCSSLLPRYRWLRSAERVPAHSTCPAARRGKTNLRSRISGSWIEVRLSTRKRISRSGSPHSRCGGTTQMRLQEVSKPRAVDRMQNEFTDWWRRRESKSREEGGHKGGINTPNQLRISDRRKSQSSGLLHLWSIKRLFRSKRAAGSGSVEIEASMRSVEVVVVQP